MYPANCVAGVLIALISVRCEARRLSQSFAPQSSFQPSVAHYELNATVGWRSPDCFARPVILVNDAFVDTTFEVTQGQILEVAVQNNLPPDYPLVLNGFSIHWHGLDQRGTQWYDGTGYVTQCPIPPGQEFTYRFQVNDQPGTYMWHGHSGTERGDGLEGVLIIRPPGRDVLAGLYDEEVVISMTDWWHDLYGPLAYATSRPFDSSKVTNDTGPRVWIDLPHSILINGKGYWQDCHLGPFGTMQPPTCNVTVDQVPGGRSAIQPGATLRNQGCEHYTLVVDPGKRYRLRLVNFSTLMMLSFAIEGHNLEIVAVDATPTDPIAVDHVDINSGDRYDVILTANATVPRTYYIEVLPQYRPGCTAGFGFLKYSNQPNLSAIPPTPTPNADAITPWGPEQYNAIHTADWLVNANVSNLPPEQFSQLAGKANLQVPQDVTVQVRLNLTEPVSERGQIHWAFNNIATYHQPRCEPVLQELYREQHEYLTTFQVQAAAPAIDTSLSQYASDTERPQVYVYGEPSSLRQHPVTGQYIVDLAYGDVVEIVMQNYASNDLGGDTYLVSASPMDLQSRTGQEQHPIHPHGHHAWSVGYGLGVWNETSISTYNLENPMYRDVFTLPQKGWHVFRFVADNPGAWEMHCHLEIHLYMGQQLVLAEAIDRVMAPPEGMPPCPETCYASFAGWNQSYVADAYGDSGFI